MVSKLKLKSLSGLPSVSLQLVYRAGLISNLHVTSLQACELHIVWSRGHSLSRSAVHFRSIPSRVPADTQFTDPERMEAGVKLACWWD